MRENKKFLREELALMDGGIIDAPGHLNFSMTDGKSSLADQSDEG